MIICKKHGWCDIALGEFVSRASYLTNVPMDIANAFVQLCENASNKAVVEFDAEGWEYDLVISRYGESYIVDFKEEVPIVYRVDQGFGELLHEFLSDIDRDGIDAWVDFMVCGDDDDRVENKGRLERVLNDLEQYDGFLRNEHVIER